MSEVSQEIIQEIVLEYEDQKVIFRPDRGMNFTSFRKGNIEAIAQSTRSLFETRNAGLGAMIGPHFHHRPSEKISYFPDSKLFPFVAEIETGKEPFSHGIGRYVAWNVREVTPTKLVATLSGKDAYKGIKIQELEGQDFNMTYCAQLSSKGLLIDLSIESDLPTVIGLHTYYACESGCITAQVEDKFRGDMPNLKILDHQLAFDLVQNCDLGFFPYPKGKEGQILLKDKNHWVNVQYTSDSEEHSWQLWYTSKDFVCIEPLSAKDPRNPSSTKNHLSVLISIGDGLSNEQ